jgi:hypothetical protein
MGRSEFVFVVLPVITSTVSVRKSGFGHTASLSTVTLLSGQSSGKNPLTPLSSFSGAVRCLLSTASIPIDLDLR